jgi:hypothetical protein
MHTVIQNTPTGLIPKELFKEEKTQEYWNVLCPNLPHEKIGVDELEEFYLLYPKQHNDVDTIHQINLIYQNIKEKSDAIALDLYKNSFNLLVLKNMNIAFTGYFNFAVNEDIVYHIAHVALQYFEDISQINVYYKQLSPTILNFLKRYFEMVQL